jgi:hypothetical protein
MVPNEVGRDPEEPRPRVAVVGIERGPTRECDRERLGGELVRELESNPPSEVAVDRGEVSPKDEVEQRRFVERRGDDRGLRGSVQAPSSSDRFLSGT